MPTPAYIDTDLYLPLGGVNGFELNGYAVNGVGYVESPFAGSVFELDPYRSILEGEPQQNALAAFYASILPTEPDLSVQVSAEVASLLWAARCEAEVERERNLSELAAQEVSLELEVSHVSMVPTEYRTAYVLATHPSLLEPTSAGSSVDELPPSEEPDTVDVSVVPKEYRKVTVPRGDS
jgi:hypothetical protein